MLIQQGYITEDQLSDALKKQKEHGKRLGRELIDDGYITETQLIDTLRIQLGIDFIDLTKTEIDPSMAKYVPKALARKDSIIPVRVSRDTLFLAMADPLNFMALEEAHHQRALR